ncbi:MAG: DUF1015 domain-containing protein [Candidatus Sumerlaeia bacterium]|nr:DUF1015 domain-containing protein [Candidatus Sumerlaeia bacterium]
MATFKPFLALRPDPARARRVCTLPYDVMSTAEARRMAEGNSDSFLRVTRPEIELPDDVDPHAPEVYARGAANLRRLIDEKALVREDSPVYLLYRLVMGEHSQLGIVGLASCAEYDAGIVKKHELTRPDKEDDRTVHINILGAQTGLVFLTYRAEATVDALLAAEANRRPADIDLVAEDGIRHSAWIVRDPQRVRAIEQGFVGVPAFYVADGHHRSAAASRVAAERRAVHAAQPDAPWNSFITVAFPHDQVRILDYNRVVQDLNGLSPDALLAALAQVADVGAPQGEAPRLRGKGELALYLAGQWRTLQWKPAVLARATDPVAALDVSVLQDNVLAPLLAIGDPRLDKRIAFVGGIRGTGELQRLVDSGAAAVAFALFPTSLEDLMTIADQGGLMPPKSTWFEPKLRDGMAVHLL